jgi:ATP-dependent DNA helicase RecQ
MADLDAQLAHSFGYDAFLPGQREVIDHLMCGRSAAAVLPTGGGKSLCYQLPALLLDGLTLVVSPLIALMKDQIDALERRGIAARRLDSSLGADAYRRVMNDVREGRVRLLYVAPERFANERFRNAIGSVPIALFAIDEAHCISEWGHNFRPDYLKLAAFARTYRAERVLALTATATAPVLADICRALDIDRSCAVRTRFYRPNLTLLSRPVEAAARDAALRAAIMNSSGASAGATVVYVTQQRTAERVAGMLRDIGVDARAYHAGFEPERRAEIQEWFMASTDGVVVATIAFGMGIDKSDIRSIIHYNLPKSLEGYAQEIGRAGRDGEPATCTMLACPDDLARLESFVYGDTPSRAAIAGLVESLAEADPVVVSEHQLSAAHDIRTLVVRTLLTYLELDGYLESGTPFFASYKFQPSRSSAEILADLPPGRRAGVAAVLRQSTKARTWFSIDVDRAAEKLEIDRRQVIDVLDELAGRGDLELRPSQVRRTYRWIRRPDDRDALVDALFERARNRERGELRRLAAVVELAGLDGCLVASLGDYFGEQLDGPCGHCSHCLDGRAAVLPPRVSPPVDPEIVAAAAALRSEHPAALDEPRALTRFLCGVGSPRLSRAKLTRHDLFGALGDVPFAEVLDHVTKTSTAT